MTKAIGEGRSVRAQACKGDRFGGYAALMGWLRRIRFFFPQEISGPMAALYEKVAAPALAGFYRQVASEVNSSVRFGRILDVGSGPGCLLAEMLRHNPALELVGVDLSRRMLKIARSVTRGAANADGSAEKADRSAASATTAADARSIGLLRGDVRDLSFRDGAFDLVVSTLSLHHWREPARGIQECLRVTAPGGQCWIYDLRTDAPARTHAKLVTGKGLRRLVLGWVFKFHGVRLREYATRSAARWLRGATVRTEVKGAYLKLSIS